MKIGITGQSGFIGENLTLFCNTKKEDVEIIPFDDCFFQIPDKMKEFVKKCDAIVHLAAQNRGKMKEIYDTNHKLTDTLIESLQSTKSTPHVIFASSTHEFSDNLYGLSKKECRLKLASWAKDNHAKFTGMIIPNVFGPFGKPNYNSVATTFCYNLSHGIECNIIKDNETGFIYVGNLCEIIWNTLSTEYSDGYFPIDYDSKLKVSDLLDKISYFKNEYLKNLRIPKLQNLFDINLFNTFRSYIPLDFFPVKLKLIKDERGILFEILKSSVKSHVFFSSTNPGFTRGNHYHTRKIERFCVANGEAEVNIRKINSNEVISYKIVNEPSIIDMPIYYTHNVKNCGEKPLHMLFWANEFFDPDNPDTYYEEV